MWALSDPPPRVLPGFQSPGLIGLNLIPHIVLLISQLPRIAQKNCGWNLPFKAFWEVYNLK